MSHQVSGGGRAKDLEQQGNRHIREYAGGIDRDQAGFNRPRVADVVAGNVVSDGTIFLVIRFVNTQHKGPATERLPYEFEATLLQRVHVPVGTGNEVMEGLQIRPCNTTNRR